MQYILAVFIGGGIGAVLSYMRGGFALRFLSVNLPWATVAVTITGWVILGIFYALFIDKPEINTTLKLALTAGFCGGLTTFSTFSLELFEMINNSQFINFSVYLLLSIIAGLAAVWIGVNFAKVF